MPRREKPRRVPPGRPFLGTPRSFIPGRQMSNAWGPTQVDRNGLGFFFGLFGAVLALFGLLNVLGQAGAAGKVIAGIVLVVGLALMGFGFFSQGPR